MDASFRGYRFADFALEIAKRRLTGSGGSVLPLSGRAYDVLVHLVEHRDRVVSKDELMQAVWPQTVVEDNNLNQAISIVRRALGDSRDTPRFIVTVAGRGYQFIGEVAPLAAATPGTREVSEVPERSRATPVPEGSPVGEPPTQTATVPVGQHERTPRRAVLAGVVIAAVAAAAGGGLWWSHTRQRSRLPKSIAVLPFRPLVPETRNPAMELGVTELLVNRLSRLPGIVVSPLSSVMRFAARDHDPLDTGRQLGVDAVVDGHMLISDDSVRLTARLLAVDNGASLWANSYTERLGALLAVQESLVMQLAQAIMSELSDEARLGVVARETSDVEAWQLYANGRYQLEQRDAASLRRAAGYFEEALRRDPRFALASAGLSDAHALTAIFGLETPPKAFGQARQAALRALELDPRLPLAHTALGHVITQFDRDLEGGRRSYLQALKFQPEFTRAMAYMALNLMQAGDLAGANDYIRKARALEPASLSIAALGGWVLYHMRAYDDAERELSRIVDLAPDAALPRQFLAHVLLFKREGAKVVRLLEGRNDPAPFSFSNLTRAYAQTGNVAAANAGIARLRALGASGYGVGFELALIYLELGDRSQALEALERGVHDHSQAMCYLNVQPALDPLRGEARFRAIGRRLGLE